MADEHDVRSRFIDAACVPLDGSHAAGTLDEARGILTAHPNLATSDIHTAAIVGDADTVRAILQRDPSCATTRSAPRDWDPLTFLCFSRFLRLDRTRSEGFVRSAEALLDAGADPNTGWYEKNHQPNPVHESALYGAAGVARQPGVTRLLLERGANPNDEEVPYHAPEGYDNEIVRILVESGKLNEASLATMLLRKADWHDLDGIAYLLANGADPNRMTQWGRTATHQALQRDDSLAIVETLLNQGADPTIVSHGVSAVAIAARRGRRDVLDLFAARGIPIELTGLDRLLAACARDQSAAIRALAADEPPLVAQLVADGGKPLAEFAGVGNTEGVRNLLDLGVPVDALYREGDGYYDIARDSTALHVAAWRARHETVKLLVARGAAVNLPDGQGRTPLARAVKACVDSFWTNRRSPESVATLLAAGARPEDAVYPCGYAEVDQLLAAYRPGAS